MCGHFVVVLMKRSLCVFHLFILCVIHIRENHPNYLFIFSDFLCVPCECFMSQIVQQNCVEIILNCGLDSVSLPFLEVSDGQHLLGCCCEIQSNNLRL